MTGPPVGALPVPGQVLTAVLAALAVLLLLPRGDGHGSQLTARTRGPGSAGPRTERALLLQLRPLLTLVAGGGGWALLGGLPGVVAGPAAAVAVWVVLGRTEPPSVVRRREQLLDDLPLAVDLLGACLAAGAAPESALVTVGRAVGGPVEEEFLALHHRLGIGVDPAQVGRTVAEHPQLGPLGRAVGRAHDTGASVGRAVHQLAAELRERALADVEARARSIEVKAAAPLGLCLLPAFVVLGVVPMVVGVFASMEVFR
jgi:Flp pilus assembly protein TadB